MEGAVDLAVGLGDQACQLGERLLEVLALLGELADVRQRLLVLALGERVDRAQLLAPAPKALEAALDLLALGVADRRRSRLQLTTEHAPKALQLGTRLLAAIAKLRRADLGVGDRIGQAPKPPLKLGLLGRARAKGRRHVVSAALADGAGLEHGGALAGRVACRDDGRDQRVDLGERALGDGDGSLEGALPALGQQLLGPVGGGGRAAAPPERRRSRPSARHRPPARARGPAHRWRCRGPRRSRRASRRPAPLSRTRSRPPASPARPGEPRAARTARRGVAPAPRPAR